MSERRSEREVPEVGLEPTRPCGHWILNPARLPIPPLWPVRYRIRLALCHAYGDW
jgi:hypothetical protein